MYPALVWFGDAQPRSQVTKLRFPKVVALCLVHKGSPRALRHVIPLNQRPWSAPRRGTAIRSETSEGFREGLTCELAPALPREFQLESGWRRREQSSRAC